MDQLSSKACRTISKIRSGTFRPRKAQSRRGTHRLFAVLPQSHFATRYLPIDTGGLLALLSISWRERGYSRKERTEAAKAFKANRAEGWSRIFRLERLKGIRVPGMPVEEGKRQRGTPRRFGFFMATDGVGCSFICRRPHRAAQPPPTPETVRCNPNEVVDDR